MVVPFQSLMQANNSSLTPNDENYIMPRIVDFGALQALQSKMTAQLQQGILPGIYKDCTTIDTAALGKEEEEPVQSTHSKEAIKVDDGSNHELVQDDKGAAEITSNNVLVGEKACMASEPQGNNEPPSDKLPGFERFLECLQPQSANNSIQDIDTRYIIFILIQ